MKFIMYSLCQHEEIDCRADDNEDHQCKHQILLDTSRLDSTQPLPGTIGNICRAIAKETVDHRQIKFVADDRTQTLRGWSKDVQEAVDQAFIEPLVNKSFCKPVGGSYENGIVDFVNVILIFEQWDLQSILGSRIDI